MTVISSAIIRCDPNGPGGKGLNEPGFVDPADVTSGVANDRCGSFYESADEKVSVGVWACEPYSEPISGTKHDEYMLILEGAVTITDAGGHAEHFKAGDSLVMPRGFKGTWSVTAPLKKYYVIVMP